LNRAVSESVTLIISVAGVLVVGEIIP